MTRLSMYIMLAGAAVYFFWEGWPPVTSIYYAYTTLTTIGFGDFVPGIASLSSNEGVVCLCIIKA